jgi:hypothetical protein
MDRTVWSVPDRTRLCPDRGPDCTLLRSGPTVSWSFLHPKMDRVDLWTGTWTMWDRGPDHRTVFLSHMQTSLYNAITIDQCQCDTCEKNDETLLWEETSLFFHQRTIKLSLITINKPTGSKSNVQVLLENIYHKCQ